MTRARHTAAAQLHTAVRGPRDGRSRSCHRRTWAKPSEEGQDPPHEMMWRSEPTWTFSGTCPAANCASAGGDDGHSPAPRRDQQAGILRAETGTGRVNPSSTTTGTAKIGRGPLIHEPTARLIREQQGRVHLLRLDRPFVSHGSAVVGDEPAREQLHRRHPLR